VRKLVSVLLETAVGGIAVAASLDAFRSPSPAETIGPTGVAPPATSFPETATGRESASGPASGSPASVSPSATEAPEALGVSYTFFQDHIAGELRRVGAAPNKTQAPMQCSCYP
jgi:hypothetical protein